MDDFLSYSQGGTNTINVESFKILYNERNRLTILLTWEGKTDKNGGDAIIIFELNSDYLN
jgi:hypothetical protein